MKPFEMYIVLYIMNIFLLVSIFVTHWLLDKEHERNRKELQTIKKILEERGVDTE